MERVFDINKQKDIQAYVNEDYITIDRDDLTDFFLKNDFSIKNIQLIIKYDKKSFLNEEEKEYLKNFLKPFKDNIDYLSKEYSMGTDQELIIYFKNGIEISLPPFERNKYYKNLIEERQFTLEELELFD